MPIALARAVVAESATALALRWCSIAVNRLRELKGAVLSLHAKLRPTHVVVACMLLLADDMPASMHV